MKALLLSLSLLIFSTLHAQEQASLDLLSTWMTGSFHSAAQAERDTNYLDISLEMVRIWPKHTDGVWLYVEQAATAHLDHPYRQRIYQLVEEGENSYVSVVYRLPDAKAMIGAHQRPEAFDFLEPGALERMDAQCEIALSYQDDTFTGGTKGKCPNTWQGADYATSLVTISKDRLVSWDRGWNAQDEYVWGAEHAGYEFVKK